MNERVTLSAYGELIEPTTLQIQRLLAGSPERVWAYLTQSELRRRWLASGEMQMKAGTAFSLTWRNDELTDPPGTRPDGFGEQHSMEVRVIEIDPPRKLVHTFGVHGEVTFELEPVGSKTLLTLTHRRLPDRATMLKVGAGWHMHLDVLVARVSGTTPEPFWDGWSRLKNEYDRKLPT